MDTLHYLSFLIEIPFSGAWWFTTRLTHRRSSASRTLRLRENGTALTQKCTLQVIYSVLKKRWWFFAMAYLEHRLSCLHQGTLWISFQSESADCFRWALVNVEISTNHYISFYWANLVTKIASLQKRVRTRDCCRRKLSTTKNFKHWHYITFYRK